MSRPKAHYSLIVKNHATGERLKVELVDLPFVESRRFRLRVNGPAFVKASAWQTMGAQGACGKQDGGAKRAAELAGEAGREQSRNAGDVVERTVAAFCPGGKECACAITISRPRPPNGEPHIHLAQKFRERLHLFDVGAEDFEGGQDRDRENDAGDAPHPSPEGEGEENDDRIQRE